MSGRDRAEPTSESLLEHEARLLGMHSGRRISLEGVERRRSELWTLAFIVMLGLAVSVVLLTVSTPNAELRDRIIKLPGFRYGLIAFPVIVALLVTEKERHLRRLSRMLIEERVLTAALSNRLKELATMHEAGKAVNSVLALEDVLDIILSSAVELLGANSGSIMLLDSPEELRVVSERGNEHARDARVKVGEGIAGRVAQSREPLLLTGVESDRRTPVSSALCVPLVNRAELLGVLSTNRVGGRDFADYDLRALRLFAEHAAAAITNASLYETERMHVAELVELDRMKSDFVSTVSHELRTPLTAILGSAQTLMRADLPPERTQEFVGMIERQGERLLRLIEDILELQRISVDVVECIPTNVTRVLQEVAEVEAAADRRAALHAEPDLLVNGNAEYLQRVFTNLIDNAFTHGGGGHIEVEAKAVTEDGWPAVRVSVLDRGPGVSQVDAARIFQQFSRGWGAAVPGMGLGLYLVRTLVEAQRGRVWVEPRDGGGAAFRVLLPLPGPSAPQRTVQRGAAD